MSIPRKVYSIVGVILLIELAAQFYLIAAAAFSVWAAPDDANSVYSAFKSGDNYASVHGLVGTLVVPVTIVIMLAVAFIASLSRDLKLRTGGLLGLVVIELLLGHLATIGTTPALLIGALHGVVALAIVGIAASVVVGSWALGEASQ